MMRVQLLLIAVAFTSPSSAQESRSTFPPKRQGEGTEIELEKRLLTPGDFKLIGGWELPSKGAGGKGLGASNGGLFVEHNGQSRQLYICGHAHSKGRECHVLEVSMEQMGRPELPSAQWPVATPIKMLNPINQQVSFGITRPNPGGPLLSSGRSEYATKGSDFHAPWMDWYNERTGEIANRVAVPPHVDDRPAYGGGFCDIPRWFAGKYLSGRDFGVGYGGYESGQGSSPGPTLFVAERPSDYAQSLTNCLPLLRYRWTGPIGTREHRPPDYSTPIFGPPAGDEVGYWQADEVTAGPVWIDTPQLTGLCYWSLQGTGDLKYQLQRHTFSRNPVVRFYVYGPKHLVPVVNGDVAPHKVRGVYHDWPNSFKAGQWPIGAYWDRKDQLLYLAIGKMGRSNYEKAPAIFVYTIARHQAGPVR